MFEAVKQFGAGGGPEAKDQYVVIVSDLLSGERDAYGPHDRTSADNVALSLMENLRVLDETDQVEIDVAPLMTARFEKSILFEDAELGCSQAPDQICSDLPTFD